MLSDPERPPHSLPTLRESGRPMLANVVWVALFVLICATAVGLRLNNQKVAWRTPDEKIYMNYAKQVALTGNKGAQAAIQSYNQDNAQWVYPPPIRLGYNCLVALTMNLSGTSAERAAVSISVAFSLLAFFFTILLGLRFFDRWAVLIGLALMSVNPLDLAVARRAWQDSVWGGVGMVLFFCCIESSVGRRTKFWRASFWVVAGYFLLIKESSVVVYGFCTLWMVGTAWVQERSPQKCLRITIMSGGVALASFVALALFSGGVPAVIESVRHSLESRAWNEYSHRYQRGPWHAFMTGFWVITPISTLLAMVGMATASEPRKLSPYLSGFDARQRQVVWAMMGLTVVLVAALTLATDLKNLRFVTILFGPFCLLGGVGMMQLLALAKSSFPDFRYRLAVGAAALTIGLTCLMDYQRFERVFVRGDLDDLAIVRVISSVFASVTPPG